MRPRVQCKGIRRVLLTTALLGGLLSGHPAPAQADIALKGIQITYHGGTLLQHVKVAPLLYGSSWQGNTGAAYVQGFLQALFADGRYLANLAQYSAGGYKIGNGTALDPVVDAATLTKVRSTYAATGVRYQVTDEQIQAELKAQIAAHQLPTADADT